MTLKEQNWNCSNPSKEVSMILWWRSQYISLPDGMEPVGSHIKRFYLKLTNWAYEVLIRLGFIEILLGLRKPCKHMVKPNSSLDLDFLLDKDWIKSIALNLN